MNDTLQLFIEGEWVPSLDASTVPVINPATQRVEALAPTGASADVNLAVQAARRAFESWRGTTASERADFLRRMARALEAAKEEVTTIAATDVGTPLRTGRYMHVELPATTFSSVAELIERFEPERHDGPLGIVREPIGVVGCITPWNYPVHQIAAKIAPALAAGCTVVVKPSEVAPLSAWALVRMAQSVGIPPGVINLVSGYGRGVGEVLAGHPDVDMVSFTGSVRAGVRVGQVAAETVKRVTLELGGKSANVVLDDADELDGIARSAVDSAFMNSGQTCSALTRLLVPRALVGKMEALVVGAADAKVVGSPLDEATDVGPLVSEVQLERVQTYVRTGIYEGAQLLTGGFARTTGPESGFFWPPTVFGDVKASMRIAQEEIFGPVLCIMPYDTEEEAIAIANGTVYGLSGAVWSRDIEHAERVARRLRTGQVKINGGPFNPMAPFGGYKQSGLGRELGPFGLDEFFEIKALLY